MNEILSQNLTVVIFSYNRHKYLIRTINYWLNYKVKLLVLDGSEIKLDDICLHNDNVKYINKFRCIFDRLYRSSDYIQTEFMVLACDDEFYLPSALTSCINFLIKDKNYSSCGGRVIGFNFQKKYKKVFGYEQYPGLKNFYLEHNNPIERVKKHFSNYEPAHFYSVRRSTNWRQISKHIFKKDFKIYALPEIQLEFLEMISGKSKIIPELMWLRNKELNLILKTNSDHNSLLTSIENWWYDKNCKKEKNNFLYTMKKACDEILIGKNFKITENEISKLFEIYINSKLNKVKPNKKFFKRIIDLITHEKITHLFSYRIKNLIKRITNWKKYVLDSNNDLLKQARKLETEKVSVNYDELNQVILTIKKFSVYKKNKNKI